MDPRTVFCPDLDFLARGHTCRGHIVIHSREDHHSRYRLWGKTFAATTGTPSCRLQAPPETVTRVLTLLAHGCPVPAIVAAFKLDDRTVRSWLDHGRAVHRQLVERPLPLVKSRPTRSGSRSKAGSPGWPWP